MAESQVAAAAQVPQANPNQLIDIGTVAAANIANAIKAPAESVPSIKKAIQDEINAMSSHFTLAVSDVQTQYEAEVYKLRAKFESDVAVIKSEWSFVKSNPGKIGVVAAVVVLIAGVVGHFV